jgi:hypothetical protein
MREGTEGVSNFCGKTGSSLLVSMEFCGIEA